MIKTADYLVDLGPEGGNEGGRIIAEGSPEEVARAAGSATGSYLKRALAAGREPVAAELPARTQKAGRRVTGRG